MPLQTGTRLHRRYRIEGILGQGGMGAVYKAFDINLGVYVAVKENLFTTDEYARQFRREATILASLRHTSLPRVTDHFVIEGEGQYLVMDFIQGEDLRERLERDGAISESECVPWFIDICDALAYLHSRNPPILHRDLKPGNVKILPDGRAMLVDFGLAKIMDKSGTTTTGAKAMTPGFSPPEQYGTGSTDPRTDVYSLGATMYASLTATIPEDSLERAMGREELTPIRKRNSNINPALARVISKALQVRPDDRYQSANELASALNAASSASRPTIVRNYNYLDRTVPVSAFRESETGLPVSQKIRPRRFPKIAVLSITGILIIAGAIYSISRIAPSFDGIFGGGNSNPTAIDPTITTAFEPTPTSAVVVVIPAVTDTVEEPTEAVITNSVSEIATATPAGGGVGQIAYASDRSGKPQIHLVNIDGTGDQMITNLEEGACQPAWTPSGKQLVFTSPCRANQQEYPGSSLWLIDVDMAGNASESEQLHTAPGGDFDAAWSPDGDVIAFSSIRDGRPQVYVMEQNGARLQNLTGDLARDREPAWSPIGTQLVFTSSRGGTTDIWIMPEEGGTEQRFSRGGDRDDTHPDWSHDGQLVIFERSISGLPRLVVAPFDEGGIFDSLVCPEGDRSVQPMSEPNWSLDDQWIVFETWPDGVNHDIAIMRSSCTNYGLITTDPSRDFDAAWRPSP